MIAGLAGLTIAALFTGAAVYILVAEQPARLRLDDRALLAQWQPSYRRGYAMQSSLAVAGFLCGLVAWWLTGRAGFVIGALFMIANWPWTLIAMMPGNKALMAMDPAAPPAPPATVRVLLEQWARLHAVRAVLGGLAVVAFLAALA